MKKIIFLLALFSLSEFKAQWQKTNGPYTGFIELVGTFGNYVYAFPGNGTVYRSGDKGMNWYNVDSSMNIQTGDKFIDNGTAIMVVDANNVNFSLDSGLTWNYCNGVPSAVSKNDGCSSGSLFFVATNGQGVYKSTNNGLNFSASNAGMSSAIISAVCSDGSNLMALNDTGRVYYSINNGLTWTKRGIVGDWCSRAVFHNGKYYAGTGSTGMWISSDTGATWAQINSGLISTTINEVYADTGGVYIIPNYSGYFYKTTNAGVTWTNLYQNYNRIVASFAKHGNDLYAGTWQRGVNYNPNTGLVWTPQNNGLLGSGFNDILVNGSYIYAATGYEWIWVSADTGATWNISTTGLNSNFAGTMTMESVAGTVFCGAQSWGGVYKSTTNGATWVTANGNYAYSSSNVYDLQAGNVSTNELFLSASNGLYVTTNFGTTWTLKNTGLPATINKMGYADNKIFIGTNNGVYVSKNSGTTWTQLGLSGINVDNIKVSGAYAYAACGSPNYLYVSQDTGHTWQPAAVVTNNVDGMYVTGHAAFITVWAQGVMMSTNGGVTWTLINTGAPNMTSFLYSYTPNAIAGSNDLLFLGIRDYGVWKRGKNSAVTGNVFSTQGTVANGFAKLYPLNHGQHILFPDSVPVVNGVYQFNNVTPDDYFIMANGQQTFPLTVPTYHDSIYYWDSARVVSSFIDTLISRDIYLLNNFPSAGTAMISGNVTEGLAYHKMMAPGNPINDIGISLGKKPSGHLAQHVFTDPVGNYTFNNVSPGTYDVYVDIPGLPQDTLRTVVITGADTISALDFIADSTHVYWTIPAGISSFKNDVIENINVFPNPSQKDFFIKLKLKSDKNIYYELCDIYGSSRGKKFAGNFYKGESVFVYSPEISEKKQGVGYLKIYSDNQLLTVVRLVFAE